MTIKDSELRPSTMNKVGASLDVYVTDEKNFKPYTSKNMRDETSSTDSKDVTTSQFHQGKILKTITFNNLISCECNMDYEGFGGEGRVTIPYNRSYLAVLYRGVRCLLKMKRTTYDNTKTKTLTYLAFITDIKLTENTIEITINSFSKLLDFQKKLNYSNLLRSQILEEVIKSMGMKPKIDAAALGDDLVSSWTSVQKTSSKSSGSNGNGDGKMTESEITALAKKVKYQGMGSNHDLEKGYKNLTKDHKGDCYDITAGLYYAYWHHLGIPARDIVAPSKVASSGTHHCCMVKKDGNWQFPPFYDICATNLKVSGEMRRGNYKIARKEPSGNNIPPYTYSP